MKQTIPVLSLKSFTEGTPEEKQKFIQDVGAALKDVGFFSLIDHNINPDLINGAYKISQEFFELPLKTKNLYDIKDQGKRGFTSFRKESAKNNDTPDLKEFYHVGQELNPNNPLYDIYPKNVFPVEYPDFKETMLMLYRELEECSVSVLKAAALYLNEQENLFSDMVKDGNTILRAIHYPKVEEGKFPGSIRAAAHEDINFITFLCESTAPGLELLQSDGTWLPIYKLNGQIIVNSSDMLSNISNGIFKSTTHRVVNPEPNKNVARFSMPCFIHPRSEVDLSPLISCIEEVGEQRTRSISAGDFLQERLKQLGL